MKLNFCNAEDMLQSYLFSLNVIFSSLCLSLMVTFCLWTVEEALAHPYLARLHDVADEPVCPEPFSFEFEQQPLGEEQMKDMIYQEALSLNPEYA
jgi:hypothetical protein